MKKLFLTLLIVGWMHASDVGAMSERRAQERREDEEVEIENRKNHNFILWYKGLRVAGFQHREALKRAIQLSKE